MKKRLAVTLITLSTLVVMTPAGSFTSAQRRRGTRRAVRQAPDRWYTFTSPDHDFTLDFPREPDREQQWQGVVTVIRAYEVSTDDGKHFSVNFQDAGGDPLSAQNNGFAPGYEEMAGAASRESGERVVQVHRLAKNIIETELWQTLEETGANLNYLRRNILRWGRVYVLSCGSLVDGRGVDRSTCRRFFNSMRFTR